jgi:hypothetical protein
MNSTDVAREVEKIADVLAMADKHFRAEGEMNAALHMATSVRPAPLASAVHGAYEDAVQLVTTIRDGAEFEEV